MKEIRIPSLILIFQMLMMSVGAQDTELVVQTGHVSGIRTIAFSPDGDTFATGGYDSTIKLWDIASGRELRTIAAYKLSIFSIAFSPDGKVICSSGLSSRVDEITGLSRDEHSIKLWDVASGSELKTFAKRDFSIESVAFSPDGKTIAEAGLDRVIGLWDVSTGLKIKSFASDNSSINSVGFSPDGRMIVSGGGDEESKDYSVKLWSVESGKRVRTLRGHTESIKSVFFSSDGKQLVSHGYDNTLKQWDIAMEREIKSVFLPAASIAFSSDDKRFAWIKVDDSKTVRIFDSISGQEYGALTGEAFFSEDITFSPDDKTLAMSGNRTIRLQDNLSGQQVKILKGHLNTINEIAFSGDGMKLASASADHTIKLWNVVTGQELYSLKGHSDAVESVSFSTDGKSLVSASADKTIKLWDVGTGTEIRTIEGHNRRVSSAVFSPDGAKIVSGSEDRSVRLWNAKTGAEVKSFIKFNLSGSSSAHIFSVETVAFSSNGLLIASKDLKGEIILWNTATGEEVKYFEKNEVHTLNEIFAAVPDFKKEFNVTADGKFQITRSENGKLDLRDFNTGKLLVSLIAIGQKDWAAVTPEGLFDGTSGAWKNLIWRLNNNTYNHVPVEAFFNEYFYPGLFQEIMSGKTLKVPDKKISEIDIRQPIATIISIDNRKPPVPNTVLPNASTRRDVEVVIEMSENIGQKRIQKHPDSSGAKDLRLFRGGSLVKKWSGSVFEKASGCEQVQGKAGEPRRAICKAKVTLAAGENQFSAYAFNSQNVKSTDATAVVKGADTLKKDGTLYIFAVGVDKYAATDPQAGRRHDLQYAVADVNKIGEELAKQQIDIKKYARTEVIKLTDQNATKENILLALTRFSSDGDVSAIPESIRAELSKIKRSQPEDAILFHFSGHGTARCQYVDGRKNCDRFYLVPHDGFPTMSIEDATYNDKLFAASISDEELEKAFEPIDAGNLLMVIDACNSGQALESEEQRRGPMNSRGLAQLAYEKGMMILTASQSQQLAIEDTKYGHGLLTYSLLQGLKNAEQTDQKAIIDRNWFNYASTTVPNLQLEAMKTREATVQTGAAPGTKGAKLFATPGDDPNLSPEKRGLQSPRLFYRREASGNPFIVSKP